MECTFFCRMKCSRFKVANSATKYPGYKVPRNRICIKTFSFTSKACLCIWSLQV